MQKETKQTVLRENFLSCTSRLASESPFPYLSQLPLQKRMEVSQILLPPPGVDLADKITVELQRHPTHSGGGGVHNNIENLNDDNLLAQLDAIGQDDGVDFSQMKEDELLEALDALGMTEQHDLGEENTNTYLNVVSDKLSNECPDRCNSQLDKFRQIHELGLVLYEMFLEGQQLLD